MDRGKDSRQPREIKLMSENNKKGKPTPLLWVLGAFAVAVATIVIAYC
jgi:hypothetical protein